VKTAKKKTKKKEKKKRESQASPPTPSKEAGTSLLYLDHRLAGIDVRDDLRNT
jgi:hypothetical protein